MISCIFQIVSVLIAQENGYTLSDQPPALVPGTHVPVAVARVLAEVPLARRPHDVLRVDVPGRKLGSMVGFIGLSYLYTPED